MEREEIKSRNKRKISGDSNVIRQTCQNGPRMGKINVTIHTLNLIMCQWNTDQHFFLTPLTKCEIFFDSQSSQHKKVPKHFLCRTTIPVSCNL